MNLRIVIFASVVPCLLTSRPLLSEETASNKTPPSPPKTPGTQGKKDETKGKKGSNFLGDAVNWFGKSAKAVGKFAEDASHHSLVNGRNTKYRIVITTMLTKPKSAPKPWLPKACAFSDYYRSPVTKMLSKKHGGGLVSKITQKMVPILGVYKKYESVQDKVDELHGICAGMATIENAAHYNTQLQEFLKDKCDASSKSDEGKDQTVDQCTSSTPDQKPTTCEAAEKGMWEKPRMTKEQKATVITNQIVNKRCLEKKEFLKPVLEALKEVQDPKDSQAEEAQGDFASQINQHNATLQEQFKAVESLVKDEAEKTAKQVEEFGGKDVVDAPPPGDEVDKAE